jgi:hypothetical protein
MANDGSLASKNEEWIATRIKTIIAFGTENVVLFNGLQNWDAPVGAAIQELASQVNKPGAIVAWQSDTGLPTAEGEQDRDCRFAVWVVTDNARDAAARTGESGIVGSHMLVERVIGVLHNQNPNQTSGDLGRTSQECRVGPSRQIWGPRGASIVEIEVIIRDVPVVA